MSSASIQPCGASTKGARPAQSSRKPALASRIGGQSRGARTTPAAAAGARAPRIGLNAGPTPAPRFSPDSVLPLLSSAVESSAQMARFEALAGRSAMIGFFAALGIEAFSESSVFAIPSDQYTLVAAAFAASIGAAAALAAARGAGLASAGGGGAAADGAHLLEAVVSSLTASARSASGVTQLKVDEVVDFVLDEILNQSVHPVFGPLRDAGSTVVTVMEDLLTDDRPELPH